MPLDIKRFKEFRRDGWPLCPNCGEDELMSSFLATAVAPLSDYLSKPCKCLACGWDDERPIKFEGKLADLTPDRVAEICHGHEHPKGAQLN